MNIEQQAAELANLKLGALKARLHEITGTETRSNNRPYLIKRILQEQLRRQDACPAEPATSAPAGASRVPTTEAPARKRTTTAERPRDRDPRLPAVGAILEREHDGKTIKVKVAEDGFVYKAKNYRSLSAIAKEVTGTVWNGFLFFGLAQR